MTFYKVMQMANEFSKSETVLFEEVATSFEDSTTLPQLINKLTLDAKVLEQSGSVVWYPQPYSLQSFDGTDASANWGDDTQLSTPVSVGYHKHVPIKFTPSELRDPSQMPRLVKAARSRLASDINQACLNVAAKQGTLFVKRSVAASGFDDLSAIATLLDDVGIADDMRYCALSSGAYNSMGGNLAGRETINDIPTKALRDGMVGRLAGIDTYKIGAGYRLAAAGGSGITVSTLNAAVNYYIPQATSVGVAGQKSNVDNRYQTITVSSTTGVVAGDAFTVAGINAVNHVSKQDLGYLKTFRVVSVVDSTSMVISPPMITNQVANRASAQYKNCVAVSKSGTAAITFLNTVTGAANPFWHADAMSIIPGSYPIESNAGLAVMRATTPFGIELVMSKGIDIDTHVLKTRIDIEFGVEMRNPEMAGVIMFSQT